MIYICLYLYAGMPNNNDKTYYHYFCQRRSLNLHCPFVTRFGQPQIYPRSRCHHFVVNGDSSWLVMKTYLKNINSKDQALENGAWTSRVYTYHNKKKDGNNNLRSPNRTRNGFWMNYVKNLYEHGAKYIVFRFPGIFEVKPSSNTRTTDH